MVDTFCNDNFFKQDLNVSFISGCFTVIAKTLQTNN